MTQLLRALAWAGLGASGLAIVGLAYFFLSPYWHLFRDYGPGLGPRVHGLELLVGLLYCGAPGAAFLLLGWLSALGLRTRSEPYFLRLYGKFTFGLAVFAAAVLAVDYVLPRIGRRIYDRQEKARAETNALLDDPDRFAAYLDSAKNLNAPIPPTLDPPLEEALSRGHRDLARKLVDKGATVSETALRIAARQGDAETAVYLWTHAKGLTGLDALQETFLSGRLELLRALLQAGVPTDPLLRRICARELLHAFQVGQSDWEVLYPADLKGKGVSLEMFRTLARNAADKSGAMARGTLKLAVFARDVETLRMLLESGFDLHALDGQISATSLLTRDPEVVRIVAEEGEDPRALDYVLGSAGLLVNKEQERLMKDFLAKKGLRWSGR